MKIIFFVVLVLGIIAILAAALDFIPHRDRLCIQCYDEGREVKLWHISFPGWSRSYHPEHVIELERWVGTKYSPVVATVGGEENPEITASFALKIIGIADDSYVLEQKPDGHYILRKPGREGEPWFNWHKVHIISKCPYGHTN